MREAAFTPLTDWNAHERLAEVAGMALVVFTAPGCGACRRVKAELLRAELPEAIERFEVDLTRGAGLAAELEVFHLPALFLFARGEVHARVDAPARADALAEAIARAAAAPASDEGA